MDKVTTSTDIEIKCQQLLQDEAGIIICGHSVLPFGQQIDDRLWLNARVIDYPQAMAL